MSIDAQYDALKDPAWPFPWRKPRSAYDTDGPTETTIAHLVGADYLVELTGDSGIHSGRDRFRVVCLTCADAIEEAAGDRFGPGVLHPNTTGPSSRIMEHHQKRHGGSAGSTREGQ